MDENKNLNEVDEAVEAVDTSEMSQEELKKKMGEFLTKERGQAMILGYRVACKTIMDIIAPWRKKGCSYRDHERIFKQLEEWCVKALKQDEEKSDEDAVETVQN